jgi:curved DNA-binding protein CbpA
MNPYQILQVAETASPYVIRAAWAALVRECHPDGPKPNEKRTQALNEAYATLKDPDKKEALDKQLKAAAREQKIAPSREQKIVKKAAKTRRHSANEAYPPAYPGFDQEDIDEALDDLTRQVTRSMGMPSIVNKIVNVAHRAARGRA